MAPQDAPDARAIAWWSWAVVLAAIVCGITVTDTSGWLSRVEPNGSVLEHAHVSTRDAMGIPRHVVQGPLEPDGTDGFSIERSVVLGAGGQLEIALDEPVTIEALLLQATRRVPYAVEASLDGAHWQLVWSPERRFGANEVATEHLALAEPVRLAFLRVRNESVANVGTLSSVRAYEAVPEAWPITETRSELPLTAYPWLAFETVYALKLALALVGAGLCVTMWTLSRRPHVAPRTWRTFDRVLVATTVLAALGWYNWLQYSDEEWSRVHFTYWDATHYYLGAKYAPEIGYDRLYHCILAADAEAGLGPVRASRPMTRDLVTNRGVRTLDLIATKRRCTDYFSDQRWKEFRTDLAHLRSKLAPTVQIKMLQDHGYNGTPVWTLFGTAVGALGSADELRMRLAFAIDPVLIAVSFAIIGATFGARTMCLSLILFGTSFAFGNWFTGGAFMRFGWFAASVAGVCCLQRERWLSAGAFLALAALLRLFPVFLIGGVALHALLQMHGSRQWRPAPWATRFAVGVGAGAVALVLLSVPAAGGLSAWPDFVENTRKHTATAGAQNIGLDALLLPFYDDPTGARAEFITSDRRRERLQASGTRRAVRVVVGLASFALLVAAARSAPPWLAAILGLAWMGFVLDVTNYYYAAAVLFALPCRAAPFLLLPYGALLVAWAAVGVAFDYEQLAMFGVASLALLGFSGAMLGHLARNP